MSPLQGLRVLDFTHAISGPTCTGMLALLGADVVKIEKQSSGDGLRSYTEHAGPPLMSTPFGAVNAGKRSITADLKHPKAKEVIHKLTTKSDIVVENFRPGVLAKLGYGPEALRALNPKLIYASITGFGQTGPFRDYGAYDHIVQAISGLSMLNAAVDGPKMIGIPIIDGFSGYVGVIAILAALQKRHATGEGDYLDIAMLDAALKLMNTNISTYFYTGVVPRSMANRGFRLVATSEFYQARDGWIALGANNQDQIARFLDVVGHPEILLDPRFKDHKLRVENYSALKAWLTQFFLTQSAKELEPKLAAVGVPAARIRDIGEIAAEAHVKSRGLLQQTELPGADRPLTTVGAGFRMESGPLSAEPPPKLGQHTDEILAGLGYNAEEIATMKASGAF
jgi:CoA:oxalate CoA-transferase